MGTPAAGPSEIVKCKLAQLFDECKLARVDEGILFVLTFPPFLFLAIILSSTLLSD